MNLKDVKEQILALIEELNPSSYTLTDDPDIANKLNFVINQIQIELTRIKKLPAKKEIEVTKGQSMLTTEIDPNIYQLSVIRDVNYCMINDTIIFNEDGKATIYYYKYPKLITHENESTYKLELPMDLMQILPYGVAGDILKSDISANYGTIYANRYEQMKQSIDPRYTTTTVYLNEEGEEYDI